MKRDDLKDIIKQVIREVTVSPQMEYWAGFKRGQENYEDDNVQDDFTGYSEEWQKGYKKGVSEARWGKIKVFKPNLTAILTTVGNVLSHGKYRP